jgi:hypothetical protein
VGSKTNAKNLGPFKLSPLYLRAIWY